MSSDSGSIYQPPQSNVERPHDTDDGRFGSVSRALAGEAHLDFSEVMAEAWRLTKGSKGVIMGSIVLIYALVFGLTFALATLTANDPNSPLNLVQSIVSFLLYPVFAGMMLYGVKRAAGDASASFADVLSCYPLILPLIGLYLLQTLLTVVGILLLVLPGIYLLVCYIPAVALLVEKRLGIWESLETSRKAITHVWFRFFGILIVSGIATGIGGLLTLGIGFIWLIPWSLLCIAVAYRQLFGYGPERAGTS